MTYSNIKSGKILTINEITLLTDNAMLKVKPELWCDLDLELNEDNNIDVFKITKGSAVKLYWYCDKYKDSYPMSVNKKINGRGCSICSGYYIVKNNSFGRLLPEISKEWNYKKNKDKSPFNISRRSRVKYWWSCPKCKSDYEASPDKRTSGTNCPYCKGLKVNNINCLATTHPELLELWDYAKNKDLNPYKVVKGSVQKVYWKCKKCGEESFSSINGKKGCKFCAGQQVVKGVNDLWTTNPTLASILNNKEDGYKYMDYSNATLEFKCSNCDFISPKRLADVSKRGFSCNICSDSLSFGERVIYELLSDNGIKFKREYSSLWTNGKRYDFYIPSHNMIIEVHGEQHYNGSFSSLGGRTLEEEQDNDRYKRELALNNNIKHYIEIPSKSYDLIDIKNQIIKSSILKLLNLKDSALNDVGKFNNTLMTDVWNYSNEGLKITEIVEKTKLNKTTVRKYLKLGNDLGKCKYTPRKRIK